VFSFCEHGNEPSGSIKLGSFVVIWVTVNITERDRPCTIKLVTGSPNLMWLRTVLFCFNVDKILVTRHFINIFWSWINVFIITIITIIYYSDWLRAGRSRIESRWGRDFPPIQTSPGAHPASYIMGTGSFPGVKCGQGVLLTTHPLLVPRSWKSRAIPLPTLWVTPGL